MIEGMAVLHITETELARDIALWLDRVQSGAEIVIERKKLSPSSSRHL